MQERSQRDLNLAASLLSKSVYCYLHRIAATQSGECEGNARVGLVHWLLPGAESTVHASGGFQWFPPLQNPTLDQFNSAPKNSAERSRRSLRTLFSARGVGVCPVQQQYWILSAWAPMEPNRYFKNFKNSQSPVVRFRVKSSFLLFVLTTYSYMTYEIL